MSQPAYINQGSKGENMKLTLAERTVLYNLFETMKAAKPADEEFYDRLQDIVRYGFEGEYHKLAPIDYMATIDAEACTFVSKVLDMYWILQMHARLAAYEDRRLRFPGFDGNNESGYWAYAEWVVEEPGTFEGFDTMMGNLNSHMPMANRYRAMLPVYAEELRVRSGDYLDTAAIGRVLDAGEVK